MCKQRFSIPNTIHPNRIMDKKASPPPQQAASTAGNQQRPASILANHISVPQNPQTPSFFHNFFWGPRDKDVFLDLMRMASKQVANVFCADNLFAINHNLAFLHDMPFIKAWKTNCVSNSDVGIIWRRYIMCAAAYHCAHLEGDFDTPHTRARVQRP